MTEDITNQIDELEKDIETQRGLLNDLLVRKNELDLELLTIGETIRKARHTIGSMKIRKEKLTRDYWTSKGK